MRQMGSDHVSIPEAVGCAMLSRQLVAQVLQPIPRLPMPPQMGHATRFHRLLLRTAPCARHGFRSFLILMGIQTQICPTPESRSFLPSLAARLPPVVPSHIPASPWRHKPPTSPSPFSLHPS